MTTRKGEALRVGDDVGAAAFFLKKNIIPICVLFLKLKADATRAVPFRIPKKAAEQARTFKGWPDAVITAVNGDGTCDIKPRST